MGKLKREAFAVFKILFGSALVALAFRYLAYPNNIVSSGITGIAQIVNLLTGAPVGVLTIAMNVPLFLIAWKKMGHRFVAGSLLSMASNALFIDLLEYVPLEITSDPLLAAVYAGVLCGAGWGMVYTAGVCGGGVDIPARLLRRKYPHVNYGTMILILNAVTIVAFAAIFREFDSCMYTVICLFISSKVEDLLLYGPATARMCHIISEKSGELKLEITRQLGRGVTLLRGEGAWSGKEKDVILCVIKKQQIAVLRRLIREIDPNAFFVVTEASGVYGEGFENIETED